LAKFAPQLAVGAFQQRSGADQFASQAWEGKIGNGLLKVALEGGHRLGRADTPGVDKARQARPGLLGTLSLLDGLGLLQQLSPRLFLGITAFRSLRQWSATLHNL
jgi:hypothetical protein